MSYSEVLERVTEYNAGRRKSMDGDAPPVVGWFPEMFGSIADMVSAFDSSAENGDVSAGYKTDPYPIRAKNNFKLGYVCALRKAVRRQYCSGKSGVFTDVTPFRLARESHAQAELFGNVTKDLEKSVKEN